MRARLSLLLLLFAAAACDDGGDDGSSGKDNGAPCTADAECRSGFCAFADDNVRVCATPGGNTGTAPTDLEDGRPCTTDEQCRSGRCGQSDAGVQVCLPRSP